MWEKLAMLHHDLDPVLPPAAMGGGRVYASRLIGRLNDPLTRIVVVEDEERLVGFALAVIIDVIPDMFVQENSGLLADIFVEETHRRCGVGRLMVEDIKAWLKANGVRCFEWHVAEKNPRRP
ncbi:MAG: GNAT family N-acetyltransferase [Chloroflexi bacterium]|nr:GNAT family N-acetyltransferase [Chloroflexota bacterium]